MTREPGEGVESLNASTVREYRADGTLHAYRDGDEHVVVSKGNDRGDQWEKRVPAERSEVSVGDHLWTVPENWESEFTVRPNDTSEYGVYTIPSTGEIVKVSVPVKTRICDAWYGVRGVGELTVEYDDPIEWEEIDELASRLRDGDGTDCIADVLDEMVENQASIEEDIEEYVEFYGDADIASNAAEVSPLSSWRFTPWSTELSYTNVISERVEAEGETLEDAISILEEDDMLPTQPALRIRIEQ